VYSRYNTGPRILPKSTPALTVDSSVYSVINCLLCKYDFKIKK
jgi:hypothetical protein